MSKWVKTSFLTLQNVPELPGVYAIYNRATLLYIGQSMNLRNRLKTHYNSIKGKTQDRRFTGYTHRYLKFRTCTRLGEWLSLEFRMIQRLKPKLNVSFTQPANFFPSQTPCCKCGEHLSLDKWRACATCREAYQKKKKSPWRLGYKGIYTDPLNI